MDSLEFLKKCRMIDTLTESELQLLWSNLTKVHYTKNERIVKKGEFVKYIYFIEKGYAKVHSELKGKSFIINIHGHNSFVGLTTMTSREKHEFDITTLEDTLVLLIDINVIYSFLKCNGLFAQCLVKEMSDSTMHYIHHNMLTLNHNHIHGRLANTLIYLSKSVFNSLNFDLLLSRKELSQYSNISRENVIKILYEFNNEGIIKLSGKHITILNLEQLEKYADFC